MTSATKDLLLMIYYYVKIAFNKCEAQMQKLTFKYQEQKIHIIFPLKYTILKMIPRKKIKFEAM